jgi:hypothetical protein
MTILSTLRNLVTPARLLVVAAATLGVATFAGARPADASAMLTATPTDVYVPLGQMTGPTVLKWNTGSNQGAQIWVSGNGGPEALAINNAAPQGQATMQIMPNDTYTFKLYIGQKGAQPAAASVTVKGHPAKADLSVKFDGAVNGHLRITVKNSGATSANNFRIAVLAGADSYSITNVTVGAGQSKQFALSDTIFECGRPIAILVDVDHQVDESVENNNGTGFNSPCP